MGTSKFVEAIKVASIQANNSLKPLNIFVGKIKSINPLSVILNESDIISSDFLYVSETLKNRFIYLTSVPIDFYDINNPEKYANRNKYIMYNSLKVNDAVILIRAFGGQAYYIIDRVDGIN